MKHNRRVTRFYILLAFVTMLAVQSGSMPFERPGLLTFIDEQGVERNVREKADWNKKREQIVTRMQRVMGELPTTADLATPEVEVQSEVKRDGYTLLDIRYLAAPNEWVTAFLYVPDRPIESQRLPAMLVLHGTSDLGKRVVDGQGPLPNRAHAKELAERGYVVIAPDYPSFGGLKSHDFSTDRYDSGTMKGVFNHIRAIDLLVARNDVDSSRIGVIGHSLGGHNAIFLSAFDQRTKVTVSSCGWTLFDFYDIGPKGTELYGGRLGPWAQDRYMPRIRSEFKLDATQIPFDFDEAIATIAPRAFFSNSPLGDQNFDVQGVKRGVERVEEVYRFLGHDQHLRVSYPNAGHDFPYDTRMAAYAFIDSILKK